MNDAVCDAEIQSRIVEPRRQEDEIEWLQSDAFRTLVDELFSTTHGGAPSARA